ncbi:MAG TPA: type II toxin-antitoxin system VapC family toxin [Candidatus Paceibacterota bacterium]|nr:type II toxin-antitoxin system VapC family toxin [Candidatus Paceibacterota bacterium]HRZ55871.1 type II toxin-antitoxin system VapC family toxin [Candidatus Paceibacterota bacterium]
MTHLLDTHAWIQRALGTPLPPLVDHTLTRHAGTLAIADISLWEAGKLVELGRLQLSVSLAEFFRLAVTPELTVLPVTPAIAEHVTTLEPDGFHKDPADQLIVATALVHGLRLITNDTRIRQWGGVPSLWSSLQHPRRR